MATTYTFTRVWRSDFTDKTGLTITDNRQLASATLNPTNGAAIQSPRLAANVELKTGDGTDNHYLRCHMRLAPAGTAPAAGWPSPWSNVDPPFSACKFQVTAPGTVQTYGRYTWRTRRDSAADGTNNKGVAAILWPWSGGWGNSGANELDVLEFYQYLGSEDVHNMAANYHYKDASGKEQQHLNIGNLKGTIAADWTAWHTCQLDWTPTYIKFYIDGVLAYTVTGTSYVPTVPMWFGCQLAFLGVNHGATRDAGWVDFDWIEVYKLDQGGSVDTTPAAPTITSATGTTQSTVHVVWSASTNSQGTPAASYQLMHSATQLGTYTNVGTPVAGLSEDDSTLSPSTTEWFQVIAIGSDGKTSDPSAPVSGTTLANNATNPPNASLSANPLSGTVPLAVTFDLSGTTGSPTSLTLDPGDGSAPQTFGSIPSPFVYTYTGPGTYTAVLTATNANGSDTDQASIVAGSSSTPTPTVTLFPATKGAPIKSDDYNANLSNIQGGFANAAQVQGSYSDSATTVLCSQVAGEDYYRWVLLSNGNMYMGDGTFDPTTAAPIFGPDATTVTPPVQPATTESFTWSVSNSTAVASTAPTLSLPAGVVASTLAIAAVMVKNNATTVATPAGWTLLQTVSNANGNATLKVYSKVVGVADSSTTITFTLGTSSLWATAMAAYLHCTAVDASTQLANPSTAATSHPTPAVTAVAGGEYVVSISGCRFSSSSGTVITPPNGYNDRTGAHSTQASTNNMSLEIFDILQTASGASAAPVATTASGAFSVGVSVALAHA